MGDTQSKGPSEVLLTVAIGTLFETSFSQFKYLFVIEHSADRSKRQSRHNDYSLAA